MTCSECSHQIPEGSATCPTCGAPLEPEPQALKLWNPVVLCILTVPLLGSLVGSILVALNWTKLKERNKAVVAWCFWPVYFALSCFVPSDFSIAVWSFISTDTWLALLGIPQVLYFRRHVPPGYTKRSWTIPIVAGVGFMIASSLVMGLIIAYMK